MNFSEMRAASEGALKEGRVRVGSSAGGSFLNQKLGSTSGKVKRRKRSLVKVLNDNPFSRQNGIVAFQEMESSGGYCPHKKSLLETQTGLFGSGRRRAIAGLCTNDVSVRTSPVVAVDWQEFFSFEDEELEEFTKQEHEFLKIRRNYETVSCSMYYSDCALYTMIGSSQKRIGLENIELVLIGPESAILQRYLEKHSSKEIDSRLCLTIKHSHMRSLDLIASSMEVVGKWTSFLMRKVPVVKLGDINTPYLKYFFEDYLREKEQRKQEESEREGKEKEKEKEEDDGVRGEVDEQDVLYIFYALNYYPPIDDVKEMVGSVDKNQDGFIDFEQWNELVQRIIEYPVFSSLFDEFSGKDFNGLYQGRKMSPIQFSVFLKTVQGEKMANRSWSRQMISHYDDPSSTYFSLEGFSKYLLCGKVNGPFDPFKEQVFHDMTRPLNEYFIASSHNTYLENDQLKGLSSIDMYMRVLETGCRCIEIDVWDGKDGSPLITHGGTLCTQIDVFSTLTAIRKSAFTTSPFPVIISIENHCCPEQQVILAQMMKTVFEGCLPPPFEKDRTSLPSPASLQFQILLKGAQSSVKELKDMLHLLTKKLIIKKGKKKERTKREVWEMMSVSEGGVGGYEEGVLERYNGRYLSRVYPAGKRVASSNYGPISPWKRGCQLVALNYQAPGVQMLLNMSIFLQNGMCGYVLKPKWMRGEEEGGEGEEEGNKEEEDGEDEENQGEEEIGEKEEVRGYRRGGSRGGEGERGNKIVLGRDGLGLYISGANFVPISRYSCDPSSFQQREERGGGGGGGKVEYDSMKGSRASQRMLYESMAVGRGRSGWEGKEEIDWLSCDPTVFWEKKGIEKEEENEQEGMRKMMVTMGGYQERRVEKRDRLSGGGSFLYESVCGFDSSSPPVSLPSQVRVSVGVCGGRFLPRPKRGLFKDGYVSAERVVQRGKVIFNTALQFAQRVAMGADPQGVSPYVSIKVIGVADEEKQTTSVIQNNGLNPNWNESFHFKISCSEMSIIMFTVYHQAATAVILGSYFVPVSALRRGYRLIPLIGEDNVLLPLSSLLVHFGIEEL